jgi:DNA-binding transcriptional ArsR family regulator
MALSTISFPSTASLADCDLATAAALIGDPGRAAMLAALLDRRALPAGELARLARVAPATASEHLRKLVRGGLLAVESHGRHRYFRLAGPAVARVLESLALVAPPRTAGSAREAFLAKGIRFARTCYDHLAGRLGVLVADALVARQALTLDERGLIPGADVVPVFQKLGVDVAEVTERARRSRRPVARACLDWSERQYHLAGPLGGALVHSLLDRRWVERTPSSRALRVTSAGRRGLRRELEIRVL